MTRIRHLFILILLSASAQLSADESAFPVEENGAGAPPALGLALAGGGALGFAHLGVILELEEIGLNPRYLAGTSIGSIVGALYAAGYTGEEMLEIVQSVEWDNLLFDQPRRSSLNVGAREATRRFRVGARFDDWKLVTPAGISAGQRATEYLDALLSPFAGIDDFFQLPRPIGIVATDLVSGEEVVYTGGDLKNAVRASIAVPGVFTPLHYDGRYLIDGGWTNNLPVDVVKGLGADVVIAVDLFNSKRQVGQLQDVGTIVEQAGIILRQERIEENLVLADVAISPDLTGYTTIDFEKALEMVEIGRQAARDHRDELILLRNRLEAAGAVQSLVPPTRGLGHRLAEEAMRDERFSVGAVHLSVPPDRETPQSLIDVRRSLMGRTFTAEELRTEIYRLYDSGGFEYVSYDLEAGSFSTRDDAYHVLTIYAVPEKQYRSEVQLGFGTRIQLDGALNTRSVLHGNHVATLGDGLFRLDTDLWLTEVAQFRTALSARVLGPLRLGIGGYVLAPPLIFYDGRTVEALYLQRRNGLELWLESPVLRRATLGVSGFTEWFGLDRVQGRETVDQVRTRRVGVGARFHYDTLDRAFFPVQGGEASFGYRWRYDNDDRSINSRFDFSGRRHIPITDRFNLQLRLEGGSDFNSRLPAYEQHYTGGAELFEGYYYQELSGNHILTVGADVRFELFHLPLGVGESVYLRVGGNVGRIWDESFDALISTSTVAGGRIGVAVETSLGELNIGYSMNDQLRPLVYVLLGPAYTFGGNGYQW